MADYSDWGLGPWPPTGGPAPDSGDEEIVPEPGMTVPDWYDGWYAWDTCVLGNVELPGIAEVEVETERDLDVKSGSGTTGGTITDKGYKPGEVKIKLRMWNRYMLGILESFMQRASPKRNTASTAFDIIHPTTQLHGITSVAIQKMSGPKKAADGSWEFNIDCVEWFPAPKKNTTKTTKTSKAADDDDEFTKNLQDLDDDDDDKPSDNDTDPEGEE